MIVCVRVRRLRCLLLLEGNTIRQWQQTCQLSRKKLKQQKTVWIQKRRRRRMLRHGARAELRGVTLFVLQVSGMSEA